MRKGAQLVETGCGHGRDGGAVVVVGGLLEMWIGSGGMVLFLSGLARGGGRVGIEIGFFCCGVMWLKLRLGWVLRLLGFLKVMGGVEDDGQVPICGVGLCYWKRRFIVESWNGGMVMWRVDGVRAKGGMRLSR